MEKINLKNLTQLELLELRHNLEEEIQTYSNREKKMTWVISQNNLDTRYFSKRLPAYTALQEMLEEEEIFENDTKCSIQYLTTEEWRNLCEDLI